MNQELVDFESNFSVLDRYGTDITKEEYITNPAIGRDEQIKELILILLTPEKSAILIGKPGIGKTAIVEGLAYRLQHDDVPEALKGYSIVNIKTASLLGTMPSGESKVQKMIDELKTKEKMILFIDEVHMLIGATDSSALDFANIFKEGLGRGSIKVIGATTTEEYERYILRDKAFTRRFQKVDVPEPTREETIKIMMGTLPKFEKQTGRKMKYTDFIKERIMSFLVDITSEYKRVFALGSRYPDVCLTLLKQAFSYTVFDDRPYMDIFDVRKAIENSKNIYPDVIKKELPNFDKMFNDIILEEKGEKPVEEWRREVGPTRKQYVPPTIIEEPRDEEKIISKLNARPSIIDKGEENKGKPIKSIIAKEKKHSKIGSTAIPRGLKERINRKNDSSGIDELLTSSGIGIIEPKKETGPKLPSQYVVRDEIAPGVGDDYLLGRPIESTVSDIQDNEEVVDRYRIRNGRKTKQNEGRQMWNENSRKPERQDISTQNFDKYHNFFHQEQNYQNDYNQVNNMNNNQNNFNNEEMDNVRRIDMLMGKTPNNNMPNNNMPNNNIPNNYQNGPYQNGGNMPPMGPQPMNGPYNPPMGPPMGGPPMSPPMNQQMGPNNGFQPGNPNFQPNNGPMNMPYNNGPQYGPNNIGTGPNNMGQPPMGPNNFINNNSNDRVNSEGETLFGAPMYGTKEDNSIDNIPDIYTTDNQGYNNPNYNNPNTFVPPYPDNNQYQGNMPNMNNGGGSFLGMPPMDNNQPSGGETLFGAPMYSSQQPEVKPNNTNTDDNIILNQLMSDNMKIKDGKIVDEFPTFDKISNLSSIKSVISDVREVQNQGNNNVNDMNNMNNNFLDTSAVNNQNTDVDSKKWIFIDTTNNNMPMGDIPTQSPYDNNVLDAANKQNTISPNTNSSEPTSNKDYYEDMKNGEFLNLTELNSGKIREEDANKYMGIPPTENKPQFDLNIENNVESEKDFDDFYE